ncbi:FAD-dependent oxidoreductase [Vibrio sp. PP-XX7]
MLTSDGEYIADNYVLCLGANSYEIAKGIGLSADILPVRGFSATIKLTSKENNIKQGIEDGGNFLALNKLGERLRISCNAEFLSDEIKSENFNPSTMISSAKNNFKCNINNKIDIHQAFRPMSPSTVPLIGKTKINNLFFNTGHGHLGWTFSFGSAKLIVDYINKVPHPLLKEISSIHNLIGD